MPYCLRSNVVYKFSCGRCNATYYGETCWHLSIRIGKNSGVLPLTGKKSKSKMSTAVKCHKLFCDHIVSIDDFKILTTSDSDFHVKVKESLLISHDEPILKVVSVRFLLVGFVSLPNWERCFLFHFKSSFCSQENQILEFYILKFHDAIK